MSTTDGLHGLSLEEGTKRYHLDPHRNLYKTKCVTLSEGDPHAKAEEIRKAFHLCYEVYEKVLESLNGDEAFLIPPVHGLRHPIIFYLGHTAAFYINKLALAGLTTRINPKYEEMFAVGVDEMSWDDLNAAHYDWPKPADVWAYRNLVRDRMEELFHQHKAVPIPLNYDTCTADDEHAFWWTVLMAIEHERIHVETASVHVRELPLRLVKQFDFWRHNNKSEGEGPANELVAFHGGKVAIGRSRTSPVYGWDSDYSADGTSITVAPFKASKYLVSNTEFLGFMKAGGYTTEKYWTQEGWKWVTWKKPEHPWFWVKAADGSYKLRLQVEEVALPLDWPVEVNQLEAKAFCNWMAEKSGKHIRLPTEAEWKHLHDKCVAEDEWQWKTAPGNINLEHGTSACPVNRFKQGELYDVIGNAWQHCETTVYPYPGYRVHPYYDDFSMPTFDGRHSCMKGGCWVSTGNEATRDARFAFRRHFFQYIGIRYVEGVPVAEEELHRSIIGMDPEVDRMADLSYGTPLDGQAPFDVRIANYAREAFAKYKGAKVEAKRCMALLCGAGRSAFELTPDFAEVFGVDFTARQLQTAYSVRERGVANFSIVNEFGKREARSVLTNTFAWDKTREKASFYQADSANLHAHLKDFDLVVAYGALERTYRPSFVPTHLLSRMNPGGVLIILADYAWCPKAAHEAEWLQAPASGEQTARAVIKSLIGAAATEVAEPTQMSVAVPDTTRSGHFRLFQVLTFKKAE